MAEVTAPAHPSVRTLLESTDRKITGHHGTGYQVECVLSPVNSTAGSRKSIWWSYDQIWASPWLEQASGKDWHQQDPVPGARDAPTATHPHRLGPLGWATGGRAAKWTREDSSMRQSWSKTWHTWSKHRSETHRNESWWCQRPSPTESCVESSLSRPPSPQRPVAECPLLGLVQKQVWFNLGKDLGEAPSLTMDLSSFLEGDATAEQNDAPHHSAPLTSAPSQLPCDNGHQHHPAHTRGPWPRATVKPTAIVLAQPQPWRKPNPVDQAENQILMQMSWAGRHLHWWKELRDLY